MVERDTAVLVNDGDHLNEGYFNELFYRELASDSTADSVSSPSGSSTNTSTVTTISIPSNTVSRYIEIYTDYTSQTTGLDADKGITGIEIDIGEAGSETNKLDLNLHNSDASFGEGNTQIVNQQNRFYYTPTSLEKSNGFNIIIKITAAKSGTRTISPLSTMTHKKTQVMGV